MTEPTVSNIADILSTHTTIVGRFHVKEDRDLLEAFIERILAIRQTAIDNAERVSSREDIGVSMDRQVTWNGPTPWYVTSTNKLMLPMPDDATFLSCMLASGEWLWYDISNGDWGSTRDGGSPQ